MSTGATDLLLLQKWSKDQGGVFSKGDLQSLLGDEHPTGFTRRVKALEAVGILRRFCRGWYVTAKFDLSVLSQRIAPTSYVSFGGVLAKALLIGVNPERRVLAVKIGKTRKYSNLGATIVHVGIAPHLHFGWFTKDGVRIADPEKAVLDVLYFHLRGRRYVFDVYSDIAFDKLNIQRLELYLGKYRNARFVAFVRDTVGF